MNEHQVYWNNPTHPINQPEIYARWTERSDYLLKVLTPFVDRSDHIIELGCNIGRNLAALWDAGYHNLYGVDINSRALELSKKFYPGMKASLYHGTIENFEWHRDTYDCIFTMGVLMHLPDNSIFNVIEKRVGRVLITIEDEHTPNIKGGHHFPRDYSKVFVGLRQIHVEKVAEIPPGLTTRVFVRELV